MNSQDINELIALTNALEDRLKDFETATDALLQCETDETSAINELVERRSFFIEQMKPLKEKITGMTEQYPKNISDILKQMFSGVGTAFVPPELQALQQAVVSFRSAQNAADEKEKILSRQFDSRYNDLRDILVKLREDKKKIDLYSNIKARQLGSALDSRL